MYLELALEERGFKKLLATQENSYFGFAIGRERSLVPPSQAAACFRPILRSHVTPKVVFLLALEVVAKKPYIS
jgi:hypothetical protein